jgi:hypothetical protein
VLLDRDQYRTLRIKLHPNYKSGGTGSNSCPFGHRHSVALCGSVCIDNRSSYWSSIFFALCHYNGRTDLFSFGSAFRAAISSANTPTHYETIQRPDIPADVATNFATLAISERRLYAKPHWSSTNYITYRDYISSSNGYSI